MVSSSIFVQDATVGRINGVIDAVGLGASVAGVDRMDVAVAYASAGGVEVLKNRLSSMAGWRGWRKRFLVSIDFGTTQPTALDRLRRLPNSEVRVPHGREVLARAGLAPRVPFHSKAWIFYRSRSRKPVSIVVGSGNLTVSGLATGGEVATAQIWNSGSAKTSWPVGGQELVNWFEQVWNVADDVDLILPQYRSRARKSVMGGSPPEELSPAADAYNAAAAAGGAVPPDLTARLASAEALYVYVDRAIRNRGPSRAGSQIDTPLGTSTYFGLPARRAPGVIGAVSMHIAGFSPVSRTIRVGSNGMDKINLPIPGRDGPDTYDGTILIFERTGEQDAEGNDLFELEVTNEVGLRQRKALATADVPLQMTRGRKYGLLFGAPDGL